MLCAQQSSLILTGISRPDNNFPTDGVSSNTARSLELYVVEDISDLSMYGFATSNSIYSGDQSNGAFQFPEGSYSSGDFIYVTRSQSAFEELHGFSADYELNNLNFLGGNSSGPFCVVELLYSESWDSSDLQTIDYWASNDVNLIINGGWSKRISCNGPNAGPNPWIYEAAVFSFDTGDPSPDYLSFDINEWTYSSSNPNSITFGDYSICSGCPDINALNYCANCLVNDGSCVYDGCTDPLALNYDVNATFDDGSCIDIIAGCLDIQACNYDPLANTVGNCNYASLYYDCDGNCLNDVDLNGICDEIQALTCNTSVNIFTSNECGQWQLWIDFNSSDLSDFENIIISILENGSVVVLNELTEETNSVNDLVYAVEAGNNYDVSILSDYFEFNFAFFRGLDRILMEKQLE